MINEDPKTAIVRKYNISKIRESSAALKGLISVTPDLTPHPSHVLIVEIMSEEIDRIVGDLEKAENPRAEVKAALQGLSRLESQGFVLQNLMEAVKRDDSFSDTIARYGKLGILPKGKSLEPDSKTNPWNSSMGVWRILKSIKAQFRTVALRLISILLNALKTLPMFVTLKPLPSIGWSGFLPSFSLQFDLEAEGVALSELIDVLLESSPSNG
jgi:hypothetical protein